MLWNLLLWASIILDEKIGSSLNPKLLHDTSVGATDQNLMTLHFSLKKCENLIFSKIVSAQDCTYWNKPKNTISGTFRFLEISVKYEAQASRGPLLMLPRHVSQACNEMTMKNCLIESYSFGRYLHTNEIPYKTFPSSVFRGRACSFI